MKSFRFLPGTQMFWFCCFLTSCLYLNGCAASKTQLKVGKTAEGEVVEAEGLAAMTNDLLAVKRAALADAKKNAVEKVVGVLISAKTLVDKAITIEQSILAKTEGYVKDFKILKEGKEPDDIYHMTIRAMVSFQEVQKDLQASDILKEPAAGNPRVAILLDEMVEGEPDAEGDPSTACSDTLAQGLIDKGYRVVDRSEMAAIRVAEATKELLAGDTDKALKPIVQKLDAEVVVVGKARTKLLTATGLGGMISYRGSLTAKALRAQTGQILATVSAQGSGLDAVKEIAAEKSLAVMAQSAVKDLADRVKLELAKKSNVQVVAKGISDLNGLSALKSVIAQVSGVKDIYTRSFNGGVAQMDVNVSAATSASIGEALSKSGLKIQVSNMTQDLLEVQAQ